MGTPIARSPSMLLQLRVPLAMLIACSACAPDFVEGPWPVRPDLPPPGMSRDAWVHALAAHDRALDGGYTTSSLLTVIDYTLPSSEARLWVVDLQTGEILVHEYVAHAIRTGDRWATSFSNRDGSRQSSLGTFLTGQAYVGVRGLSLRLEGLEPGINERARARGIVIHGTPTVNATRARQGMLGRTEGCPAVSMEAARALIRLIESGVVLFVWYPDRSFLARSQFLSRWSLLAVREAGYSSP